MTSMPESLPHFDEIAIGLQILPHGEGLPLPVYQSLSAAGLDLVAAIESGGEAVIAPGERRLLPTGIAIELPAGYEAQIRPRSGLAMRYGITVLNAPGTIDADYRGEIMVLLINLGHEPFAVKRGERIAQLVIQHFTKARLEVTAQLSPSARGGGGFGSTGV